MTKTLTFKYTTSRGQDTYGYNICSLYVDNKKQFSTCGGGYDMKGTVFAQWVKENFLEKLKMLEGNYGSLDDGTGYYGLTYYEMVKDEKGEEIYTRLKGYKDENTRVRLDGACGFSCIKDICNAIGVEIEYITSEKNGDLTIYRATY